MNETTRCPSCGSNVHDIDIEAPSDDDRRYFEQYPEERVRYRSAYPSEHPVMTYPQMLARLALDLLAVPKTVVCPCCRGFGDHEYDPKELCDPIPRHTFSCGCCDGDGTLAACPTCREGVLADGTYCGLCLGVGYHGQPCEAQQ